MINLIAKRLAKGEKGFTLIELLIVIVIIAILIAVAIPAFLGARKRGQDSAAKSLIRQGQTQMEVYYTDNQTYVGANAAALAIVEPNITWKDAAPNLAKNNEVLISGQAVDAFVLTSESAGGTVFILTKSAAGIAKTTTNPAGTW